MALPNISCFFVFCSFGGEKLAVYVSDQVPEVVIGDQERFGQIITNLVGNSIKVGLEPDLLFIKFFAWLYKFMGRKGVYLSIIICNFIYKRGKL